MRQVCSSKECPGKPLSQSALSAAYARQADTSAVGGADVSQLASPSTSASPAGRHSFLANAAGGSIDCDVMASWPDATAGSRQPMGATGVSVKGPPPQHHQVRFKVGGCTGHMAFNLVCQLLHDALSLHAVACILARGICIAALCGSNDHCLYAHFLHMPAASQTCAACCPHLALHADARMQSLKFMCSCLISICVLPAPPPCTWHVSMFAQSMQVK